MVLGQKLNMFIPNGRLRNIDRRRMRMRMRRGRGMLRSAVRLARSKRGVIVIRLMLLLMLMVGVVQGRIEMDIRVIVVICVEQVGKAIVCNVGILGRLWMGGRRMRCDGEMRCEEIVLRLRMRRGEVLVMGCRGVRAQGRGERGCRILGRDAGEGIGGGDRKRGRWGRDGGGGCGVGRCRGGGGGGVVVFFQPRCG